MAVTITATEFKAYFDRGPWTYGPNLPDIRDLDIDKAIAESQAVWNEGLYPDEAAKKQVLYYLTAHFLILDIGAADGNSQPIDIVTAKHADDIGVSLHIPSWMKNSDFAMFATTIYGRKFLMLSKPYLDGGVASVAGTTLP